MSRERQREWLGRVYQSGGTATRQGRGEWSCGLTSREVLQLVRAGLLDVIEWDEGSEPRYLSRPQSVRLSPDGWAVLG